MYILLGFLENNLGCTVSVWHRKSDKDLLLPPSAVSRALVITRCLFINLGLAAGTEEFLTRDVLEEHLGERKKCFYLLKSLLLSADGGTRFISFLLAVT